MSAKESKSESFSDVTSQAKTEKESVGSREKSESGNMVSHDDDDDDGGGGGGDGDGDDDDDDARSFQQINKMSTKITAGDQRTIFILYGEL